MQFNRTISVNRISFSLCLFHVFFLLLLVGSGSISTFSPVYFFYSLLWFVSNSNPHRIEECNGKIEYGWLCSHTIDAYMLAIRQTWHTFLFDMRNCVNTQMSYWAPGIDFPSFFLALTPLIETQRNIRVWRLYVLCNVITYLSFYFLPLPLSLAYLCSACESQLCQFTIVFT